MRRHLSDAEPRKMCSPHTASQVIAQNVFQQQTKANPMKEETGDLTNGAASRAVRHTESPRDGGRANPRGHPPPPRQRGPGVLPAM